MQVRTLQHKVEKSVEVTPELAGWKYLTFRVHVLTASQVLEGETLDEEACVVWLGGSGTMEVGPERRQVAGRRHVFDGLPHFAYVPRRTRYRFSPDGPAEIAWGSAPCEADFPPRLLGPADCAVEMRGDRNVRRQITHLIDPGFGCGRLLAVEVYTPSGNWSSYPPHKHDVENPPHEVRLEEIYHYRMPEKGFAIQRLYDGSGQDDLVLVRDGDTVLVRKGYHPVVAAPGFDVYYLNILAGDHPAWQSQDDPDLAWVRGVWDSPDPLQLPMQP